MTPYHKEQIEQFIRALRRKENQPTWYTQRQENQWIEAVQALEEAGLYKRGKGWLTKEAEAHAKSFSAYLETFSERKKMDRR